MIVYLLRNRANGKGYVGKTGRALYSRVGEHEQAAKNGSENLLHRAIRKHGWESFDVSVLEMCNTDEELTQAERKWISELGTYGYGKGYNMTPGGDGWTVGRIVSEATREKLRARIVSSMTRIKISVRAKERYVEGHGALMRSKRKKGVEHPFFGKKWGPGGPLSAEHKAKVSAARRGRPLSEEHKAAISVGCKGREGPNLGKKWTDGCRVKSLAARHFRKKPVFGYDEEGAWVVTYLSVADAMKMTGLGCRVLTGDRKAYRLKYVDGITYKRSSLTIEELRAEMV